MTIYCPSLIWFLILFWSGVLFSTTAAACDNWHSLTKKVCERLHQVWTQGDTEVYFSGYAWHNRYTYSAEKIRSFNELALGGGLGKGFYDEEGDWHGLSAIAFLDSHKNVEPVAGYTFLKMGQWNDNLKFGAGYSLFVTARPDIFNGIPFPGALPWLTVTYKKITLLGTYIPGSQGAGNVAFILGKWTLDKT